MKNSLFIAAIFLLSQAANAQGIIVDNSFGNNGQIQTILKVAGQAVSTNVDLTPDNRILVLSTTTNSSGPLFCKYSAEGEHLQNYLHPLQNDGSFKASAIKSLEDGRYLVATNEGLWRFSANGTIDLSFGTGGKADLFDITVHDILISHDGRIIASGQTFNNFTTTPPGAYVLAFNQDGHLETNFGTQGKFRYHPSNTEYFNKIIEQPDGKILVAGCLNSSATGMVNVLLRLSAAGSPDLSFGVNGTALASDSDDGENYKVLLLSDGKILTCGDGTGQNIGAVARFMPDGSRDLSFGANGKVELPMIRSAYDMLAFPDGKILVYGKATGGNILARLLPNGILDPFFGAGGSYLVASSDNFSLALKLQLLGNKLITSSAVYSSQIGSYMQVLHGFVLDLNVGAVSPNTISTVWTYPNPVSDVLEVKFSLAEAAELQFELYDLQGKRIQTLVEKTAFESGEHQQTVRLPQIPAGNYFLRLTVEGKPLTSVQISKI